MNLLLIYANPSSKSLSSSFKERFLRGAKKAGHQVKTIDLYAEKFDPVLSEAEAKGKIGKTSKNHQTMIRRADYLVFIFPIWWFRAPAILEGWIDKVFTSGFAFKYKPITKTFGIPIGLLADKKAVVITCYGAPGWAIQLFYGNLAWRRFKRGVLNFFGIKKILHFPCYSAPYASEEKKQKWLKQVEQLAQELK